MRFPAARQRISLHPAAILVKLLKISQFLTIFGHFPGLSSYSGRNLSVERQ